MGTPRQKQLRPALAATFACVVAIAGTGCSASTESAQVQTVTVERTAPAAAPAHKVAKKAKPRPAPEFKSCDANIQVRAATTTCEFAQNVFWHYWSESESPSLSVYSPAAGATLSTSCTAGEAQVVCTTADRGLVKFSQAAVDSYSSAQADQYANSHDLGPDPEVDPESSDPEAGAASPDTESPGENIPNYENGRGTRVQCNDGMYSKSGGIQGACSGHGGVAD